jgi:hypothetical protein
MSLRAEPLFSRTSRKEVGVLDTKSKYAIIITFWPHLRVSERDFIDEEYTSFFDFIGKTLQSLYPHAQRFAIQNLDGLLFVVRSLQVHQGITKRELVVELQKQFLNFKEEDITRSTELAARLWLGINIHSRHLTVGPQNPRDTRIEWLGDSTLTGLVGAQFSTSSSKVSVSSTNTLLDDSFTAVNLNNICRLHLRWTDNLVDHLRLEGPRGQRSFSIYRHKLCLINHKQAPRPYIVPADVLDEAIRTLDLLFPFGDPKTEALLSNEHLQLWTATGPEFPRATELDDFKYWRSNIAQLLALFNGPPETITQTLLDTRNLPQFATLWVAIFGVFLLTILFGILATVYSIKQYRIAIKSYELSLALACQQATTPLLGFCK